jgi:hypothetical protein
MLSLVAAPHKHHPSRGTQQLDGHVVTIYDVAAGNPSDCEWCELPFLTNKLYFSFTRRYANINHRYFIVIPLFSFVGGIGMDLLSYVRVSTMSYVDELIVKANQEDLHALPPKQGKTDYIRSNPRQKTSF